MILLYISARHFNSRRIRYTPEGKTLKPRRITGHLLLPDNPLLSGNSEVIFQKYKYNQDTAILTFSLLNKT